MTISCVIGLAAAACAAPVVESTAVNALDDQLYRRLGLRMYQPQDTVRLTNQTHGDTENRLRESLSFFLGAVRTNPFNAENHAYVGNVYFRLDDFDSSKAAYRRALALDPSGARYHSNLGSLYVQAGHHSEAVQAFWAARVLEPEDGTLAKNHNSVQQCPTNINAGVTHWLCRLCSRFIQVLRCSCALS